MLPRTSSIWQRDSHPTASGKPGAVHSDGKEQFDQVMTAVRASPELVALGKDGRDQERFTSRDMIAVEARLERSAGALAARDLAFMGYSNVKSMIGGFKGWKDAGFDFEQDGLLSEDDMQRYSRHILLPEVGEQGQQQIQCLGAAMQFLIAAVALVELRLFFVELFFQPFGTPGFKPDFDIPELTPAVFLGLA